MATGEERRYLGLGVLMIVVLVLLAGGVVAGYAKVFTPAVSVTVRAERSGLLMEPGAAVAMRGVSVGEVRAVAPDADGRHAVLRVALDPEAAAHVPANVRAEIVAPTLLAGKYLRLSPPSAPGLRPIADGALLTTVGVETEVSTTLDSLQRLLTSVDVAALRTALGSLAGGLRGKGAETGELLRLLQSDGERLNPSVPTLARDLTAAAPVTETLAGATPDLVRTLDNLSVTTTTVHDERDRLPPLLTRATEVSDHGVGLLRESGGPLRDALRTLRPTAALLADYAPELPCLLATTNQLRRDLENVLGGQYPGLHAFSSVLPGSQPYRYPRDLPEIKAGTPPSCFGGPIAPADAPVPHVLFPDGWDGFVRSDQVTLRPGSPLPDPLPRPLRALTEGRPWPPGGTGRAPDGDPGGHPGGDPDDRRPAARRPGGPGLPLLGGLGGDRSGPGGSGGS